MLETTLYPLTPGMFLSSGVQQRGGIAGCFDNPGGTFTCVKVHFACPNCVSSIDVNKNSIEIKKKILHNAGF